jgi:acetyl-CoA C-acetyltransferase
MGLMASAKEIWLAAGLRTPFTKIDAGLATRDEVGLGVPVVQAMARQLHPAQQIDFALWGSVIPNLVYSNVGREVWFDAKLDATVRRSGSDSHHSPARWTASMAARICAVVGRTV